MSVGLTRVSQTLKIIDNVASVSTDNLLYIYNLVMGIEYDVKLR